MRAVFRIRTKVIGVIILLALAQEVSAGRSGDAGALFLRLGVGARASGMGGAYIGVAEDASSAYWNPAAMAAVLGTNLMLMHNEYFQSVRVEQITLTHETEFGTFGLGFTGLYMDELERYEDVPSSSPLGTFPAYDVAVSIGYARYILPDLTAGITLKPIYEKIDDSTARGLAFDVGLYHISRIQGVKLAAVIANIGPPLKFVEEEFALPRVIKIGGSYERELPAVKGRMLLALDILWPNDGDIKEHIGFEYSYSDLLFLRAGFKSGYDSQGATFGLGFSYRKVLFDYAVLLMKNDLGDSHRFSLGFTL